MKQYHYLAEYDLETDSLILKKKINTNNYSHKRKVSLKRFNKKFKKQLNTL